MSFLDRYTVKFKIVAAAIVLAAMPALLGFYAVRQLAAVNVKAADIRDNWLPSVQLLGSLQGETAKLRTAQVRLAFEVAAKSSSVQEIVGAVERSVASVEKAFADYKPFIAANTEDAKLMAEFVRLWAVAKEINGKVVQSIAGSESQKAIDLLMTDGLKIAREIEKVIVDDRHFNEASGKTAANEAKVVYENGAWLIMGAVGVMSLLAVGICIVLLRSVVVPLSRSTVTVGELAGGNVDIDIHGETRGDELGILARALVKFRTSIIDQRRMEREAEEARVAAEAERVRAQEEAIAHERRLVAESIGRGLASLAAKDLTFRLNDNLPAAYAKLQDDFNHAVEQLEVAMQAVMASSGTMSAGSGEISSAADDLSKRTEQQAASLEQTAAALDEITATGKKAAEGASHAREVVATAKSDAEKTGEVVRKTVDAIGAIERSANQISQIIGVIDEIAFQTNLLALNAGVEAARAGEAGRGFAVVASEVRALAQRSAEAAKEIKGLISTSSTQVADGVELVAETGKALERILAQVNDINKVVIDIASGAQEQATGLAQVNTAINQMDQTTQQNASMVEQSTAASHNLAQEAGQLSDLVGQFRIGGANVASSKPAAPVRRAPAPRREMRNVASRSGSSAVAKQADPAADTDWQDF